MSTHEVLCRHSFCKSSNGHSCPKQRCTTPSPMSFSFSILSSRSRFELPDACETRAFNSPNSALISFESSVAAVLMRETRLCDFDIFNTSCWCLAQNKPATALWLRSLVSRLGRVKTFKNSATKFPSRKAPQGSCSECNRTTQLTPGWHIQRNQSFGKRSKIIGFWHAPQLNRSTMDHAPRGEEEMDEHTSELQSHVNLVCRLLLEKKKKK